MNKSLNLCSKIGYFVMAGVKLHTKLHSGKYPGNNYFLFSNFCSKKGLFYSYLTQFRKNF